MAGARTASVVLIPRYTTFAGDTTFHTLPIDVVEYDGAELTAWRGGMPSGCTCEVSVEGSVDGEEWTEIQSAILTDNVEHPIDIDLDRPLLRAVVSLAGTVSDLAVTTMYLVGTLIRRRS